MTSQYELVSKKNKEMLDELIRYRENYGVLSTKYIDVQEKYDYLKSTCHWNDTESICKGISEVSSTINSSEFIKVEKVLNQAKCNDFELGLSDSFRVTSSNNSFFQIDEKHPLMNQNDDENV